MEQLTVLVLVPVPGTAVSPVLMSCRELSGCINEDIIHQNRSVIRLSCKKYVVHSIYTPLQFFLSPRNASNFKDMNQFC